MNEIRNLSIDIMDLSSRVENLEIQLKEIKELLKQHEIVKNPEGI